MAAQGQEQTVTLMLLSVTNAGIMLLAERSLYFHRDFDSEVTSQSPAIPSVPGLFWRGAAPPWVALIWL